MDVVGGRTAHLPDPPVLGRVQTGRPIRRGPAGRARSPAPHPGRGGTASPKRPGARRRCPAGTGPRQVPDPDRAGPEVAAEVRERPLGELRLPVGAVEDPELAPRAGAPPPGDDPAEEAPRLLHVPEHQERLGGEGRIADPDVPVIPVPRPPGPLRQRGRRRRDEGAGARAGEELEEELAAFHPAVPGGGVPMEGGSLGMAPAPPIVDRPLEQLLRVRDRGPALPPGDLRHERSTRDDREAGLHRPLRPGWRGGIPTQSRSFSPIATASAPRTLQMAARVPYWKRGRQCTRTGSARPWTRSDAR